MNGIVAISASTKKQKVIGTILFMLIKDKLMARKFLC